MLGVYRRARYLVRGAIAGARRRRREEAPTTGRDGDGGDGGGGGGGDGDDGDDGSGRRISTRRPRDCHRRHRWSDDVADDDDDDDDDDDIEAAWVPLTTHSRSELDGASLIER